MDLVLVTGDERNTVSFLFPDNRTIIISILNIFSQFILSHRINKVIIPNDPFQTETSDLLVIIIEVNSLDLYR